MRLPSRFIRESVKNAERGRAKANSEPGNRGRFFHDQRQTATQKGFNLRLFSGLCLQSNEQCGFNHIFFLSIKFLPAPPFELLCNPND
jgi:hypothetical protein